MLHCLDLRDRIDTILGKLCFLRTVCRFDFYTLRREHNLALLSNIYEAAPISLFWAPNGVNELPEMRFAFPLVLTGQWSMAFLTGQSWRVHNYVGPEHGFRCFIADGLNQTFSSVFGAGQTCRALELRHVIDGASLLMQKPDTSISCYFPFSVISQFGKLSRELSKVFYFILFYFGSHQQLDGSLRKNFSKKLILFQTLWYIHFLVSKQSNCFIRLLLRLCVFVNSMSTYQ